MNSARMTFDQLDVERVRVVGTCSRCKGSLVIAPEINFLDLSDRSNPASRQFTPMPGDTKVCYTCLGIHTGQDNSQGSQGLTADPGFMVQKL